MRAAGPNLPRPLRPVQRKCRRSARDEPRLQCAGRMRNAASKADQLPQGRPSGRGQDVARDRVAVDSVRPRVRGTSAAYNQRTRVPPAGVIRRAAVHLHKRGQLRCRGRPGARRGRRHGTRGGRPWFSFYCGGGVPDPDRRDRRPAAGPRRATALARGSRR